MNCSTSLMLIAHIALTVACCGVVCTACGCTGCCGWIQFAADSPVGSDHNVARTGSADILDLFNNVPPTKPHGKHNLNNRNTVTALPIDPKLLQQSGHQHTHSGVRGSRSLHPDKLFDVSMWQSFDDQNKGSSSPKAQPNGSANALNTSTSFEAMDNAPNNDVDDAKTPPSKPPPHIPSQVPWSR